MLANCALVLRLFCSTLPARVISGRKLVGLIGFVALLVSGLTVAPAGPLPPQTAPAVKLPEPPLPAGVVARIGSTLFRQGAPVEAVCYSPDGRHLAAVGANTFRVWDMETGLARFTLTSPDGRFMKVSFMVAERAWVVVRLRDDGRPELWRVDEEGRHLAKTLLRGAGAYPRGVDKPERMVDLAPDGGRLALVTIQDQLQVYDTRSGARLWTTKAPGSCYGLALEFSRDGTELAVAAETGVVIYDTAGKKIATLDLGKEQKWSSVAFSPDGSRVVAMSSGVGERAVWDRATRKQVWHQSSVYHGPIMFTPDGKRLLDLIQYNNRFIFDGIESLDATTGASKLIGPKGVNIHCVAFRPDGSRLAVVVDCGVILQCDATTWRPLPPSADPPGEIGGVCFSPDGKTLFAYGADWTGWDIRTGRQTWFPPPRKDNFICFSTDGVWSAQIDDRREQLIIDPVTQTGFRTGRLVIRDVVTGRMIHSNPVRVPSFYPREWQLTRNSQRIIGVFAYELRSWDIATGREVARIQDRTVNWWRYEMSANEQVFAGLSSQEGPTGDERAVRIYGLQDGKLRQSIPFVEELSNLSLSANGDRLAAIEEVDKTSSSTNVMVWDTRTAKVAMRAQIPQAPRNVLLSPDGRVVTMSIDKTIEVYEVASGDLRFSRGHTTNVNSLAFSPDGRLLAASSSEAPVYLWDTTGDLTDSPPPWDKQSPERVWADLAGATGPGWRAVRQLRANPTPALALLRERLGRPPPDPGLLSHQFAQLSAADFRTRERATEALQGYGDLIRAELTSEASQATSPEARARLARLVARMDAMTPDRVRVVRAVEAVEGMGTADAKALLRDWARGPTRRLLADEARAALDRLPGR